MADIKYLAGLDIDGNINLNTGQLQFAVIQPDTSDPTAQTPQVGQIYYKSDSQSLRIYSGATDGWVTVGQDSNNYVTGGSISGGTLTLTREGLADVTITGLLQLGTTSTTALAGNTTTISSAQASAITANTAKVTFPGFGTTAGTALEGDTSLFDGDYNSLSNLPTLGTAAAAAATDFVAVTGDTMSGDLNIAHNNGKIVLGNTNSGNTNNRIEGIGISGKTFVQFGYNENDGGDEYLRLKLGFNGGSTNDYNFLSASIEEENDPNNGVKSGHISIGTSGLDDIYLTADDTNVSGRLQVSGTGQSSFAGQVTIPATPVAATDAASKAYVDSQNTGSGVTQTTGTYTPQLIASVPSEWVISSYNIQQGKWVRTGNMVFCDFWITINASNISGNTSGTSGLTVQGWPYDHDGGAGSFQGGALNQCDGFDVQSAGTNTTLNSGLGNAKLNILKQNTAITNYFVTQHMQTGDLNNGNQIYIIGSFSYLTTDAATLNPGATIDS